MKTRSSIKPVMSLAIAMIVALTVLADTKPTTRRSEPKRPVSSKVEASPPAIETTPRAERRSLASAAQAERTEPEAQILKDTRAYEKALQDLAAKAERIVKAMPDDPDQLAKDFHDIREVLLDARTNLMSLLERRTEIQTQAEAVLQSAAAVRQNFMDLAKRIDESTEQLRQKPTDNPGAVESAARAMQGIKEACQKGEAAVAPLREQVMETHREAQSIFAELEAYPQIFSYAIEAAELYEKGLGEPASYISVVQGLYKARENLRAIISTFIQAATKAEDALKKIPQPPRAGPVPVS